jgi:hypothetical protein
MDRQCDVMVFAGIGNEEEREVARLRQLCS